MSGHRARVLWGAALLAIALSCDGGRREPATPFRGMQYAEPAEDAPDFTLTDQDGSPFHLAEHRGRVLLLFFGFVHCPDVCPVTLSTWAKVQTQLADARDRVEFVFVTVDPERDTPESLRRHLDIYGQDFHGLTDSQERLADVYRDYGIFQEKVPIGTSAGGYVIDHSTRMILIDARGRLRLRYAFDATADDIVHDIRRLLSEETAP